MIFVNLVKITLDIIRYLSIFVKSRPLQDFDIIRSKSEKCENSAKNWPDYVKITPQNSTDYVKSLCKNNRICDLQIANPCIISKKSMEKNSNKLRLF